MVLAFLLELWDNSIRSSKDFTYIGGSLTQAVYSIDDNMSEVLKPQERSLYAFIRPRSAIGEASPIRTNVLFRLGNDSPKVILVTSSVPQEGKSFHHLTLQQLCRWTILSTVDRADLRRPTIHRIFGLDNGMGLSDFLLGKKTAEQAIKTPSSQSWYDDGRSNRTQPIWIATLKPCAVCHLFWVNMISYCWILPVNMVTDPLVLSQCGWNRLCS